MSYLEDRMKRKNGLLPKMEFKKPPKPLKKVSDKKAEEIKAKKGSGDSEMDLFFDAMLKRCTGKCLFCNGKTTAIDNNLYRDDNPNWSQEANDKKHEQMIESMRRASVAHLLPKRPIDKGGFPSIGAHEDNWIELCWACHSAFDSGTITWMMLKDSKEWEIIKEKLLNILPMVAESERKNKLYSKLEKLVYEI